MCKRLNFCTKKNFTGMKFNIAIFCLALLALASSCQAEEELVLQEGEIHGAIHEANIGKVTFMGEPIPMEDYSETVNSEQAECISLSFPKNRAFPQ